MATGPDTGPSVVDMAVKVVEAASVIRLRGAAAAVATVMGNVVAVIVIDRARIEPGFSIRNEANSLSWRNYRVTKTHF